MTAAAPKPPFAGGRRLERVRCDDCEGAGIVAVAYFNDTTTAPCAECRGRKFVWVSILDEGER